MGVLYANYFIKQGAGGNREDVRAGGSWGILPSRPSNFSPEFLKVNQFPHIPYLVSSKKKDKKI